MNIIIIQSQFSVKTLDRWCQIWGLWATWWPTPKNVMRWFLLWQSSQNFASWCLKIYAGNAVVNIQDLNNKILKYLIRRSITRMTQINCCLWQALTLPKRCVAPGRIVPVVVYWTRFARGPNFAANFKLFFEFLPRNVAAGQNVAT